jgi:hypothetical protein
MLLSCRAVSRVIKRIKADVTCDLLDPFSKEVLIQLGCSKPSLINLSGMPLGPREVQRVYQLNLGVA